MTTATHEELELLRGQFLGGWTDDDVERVLSTVSAAVGQRVVAVWQREEEVLGGTVCHGDSALAVIADDGTIAMIPEELWDLLIDGSGDPGDVLDAFPVQRPYRVPAAHFCPTHTDQTRPSGAGPHNLVVLPD